jgi:hypothetical protein
MRKTIKNIVIAVGMAPEIHNDGRDFQPPIVILQLPDYDPYYDVEWNELYEIINAGDACDGVPCITDIPGIYLADFHDFSFINVRVVQRRGYHAISDS